MKLKRIVPNVKVADGKLLTLRELSRSKEAPLNRSDDCLRRWITRGVRVHDFVVHLPHLNLGGYMSSIYALRAFLEVLQDISHANTAKLADKLGPPVVALRGDVFRGMG